MSEPTNRSAEPRETTNTHRLPRAAVPEHYDLTLAPDLDAGRFAGSVIIRLRVEEPTDRLVLNAAELDIIGASIDGADLTVQLDPEAERLVLTSTEPLEPGPLTLDIVFAGVLNDKLRGFYRSQYTDTDGTTRTLATTQFESTNARRAFPCWDEPDRKATFAVTLDVAADLLAISCGPEIERTALGDGRVRVRFGTTMLMSTYLLAFVVGPLEATEAIDVDGTPLRIVHPTGKGHLTDFALEVGAFALRHFTGYFGIPYPAAKLDLVAIPDFAFGAMENLGCVTFRERLLLLDPERVTQPEQEQAADVIAHEIAHMWFGDLVTMDWWEGIWLKEAFATFCEMHCTDSFRPAWQRWAGFGLSRTAAFTVDALAATRPIEYEVISPDDAEAMYDVLTYDKGAAVVRMMEQHLGPEVFRAGVRSYLTDHSYRNTRTTDLWDALEAASGQPVRATMDSWIYQGGFPLVTVDRSGPGAVRLTQQRFRSDGEADDTTWIVPLSLGVGRPDGTTETLQVLLEDRSAELSLGGDVVWVAANRGANGFYRVHYVDGLRTALIAARDELEPVERYGLVDDSWAALVAGVTTVDAHLELCATLARDEDDLAVWQRIVATFLSIDHHLEAEGRLAFSDRIHPVLANGLERAEQAVGLAPDDDRRAELHATLAEALGVMGDQQWRDHAAELIDDPDASPPLRSAAIRILAAAGTPEDFARFTEAMRAATTPQDEGRYRGALADFPGDGEAAALLTMIEDRSIRSQDAPLVLARAMNNTQTGPLAWSWVRDNWALIEDRLPSNLIPRVVGGVPALADPQLSAEIHAFFRDHPVPQAGRTLDQSLERLRINVALRPRIRAELEPAT